jgi:hypothetical protein
MSAIVPREMAANRILVANIPVVYQSGERQSWGSKFMDYANIVHVL